MVRQSLAIALSALLLSVAGCSTGTSNDSGYWGPVDGGEGSKTPKPPQPSGSPNADPPASAASPKLNAIDPLGANADGSPVDITLSGADFVQGAKVSIGGTQVSANFVDATQLQATIPGDKLKNPMSLAIKVLNPPKQGGSSNALTFTVTGGQSSKGNPVSLDQVDPTDATAGTKTSVVVAILGSGFTSQSIARFNTTDLSTSFINDTKLRASIPPGLLKMAGTFSITVRDKQSNAVSKPQTFTIDPSNNNDPGGNGNNPSPSKTDAGTTPHGNSCQKNCEDYGYTRGQCYQDWQCGNDGCLTQHKCTGNNGGNGGASTKSCQYKCADYDYNKGQCYGDWECESNGCLIPKKCAGAKSDAGSGSASDDGGTDDNGGQSCEYPCADPNGAWSYATGECTNNYECEANGCLQAKICSNQPSTDGGTSCEYPCVDPNGAWAYSTGDCNNGYQCQDNGCLVAATCASDTTDGGTGGSNANCEYPCVDPSGAWAYSTGDCHDGYQCEANGCLVSATCAGSGSDSDAGTDNSGSTGGATGSWTCDYPCVDPNGAWSYSNGDCHDGFCCSSDGCLYNDPSYDPNADAGIMTARGAAAQHDVRAK